MKACDMLLRTFFRRNVHFKKCIVLLLSILSHVILREGQHEVRYKIIIFFWKLFLGFLILRKFYKREGDN